MIKRSQALFTTTIVILLVVMPMAALGQCEANLSKKGLAHWKVAETLTNMASSIDDYEQIVCEYEQIIHTDPNYAPVYMKLGKLYTQIGNKKGLDAFNKAESNYLEFKALCPDSTDVVDIELAILDALRRKYENGPNRFDGVWGEKSTINLDRFYPVVEILYDKNEYSFRIMDESIQNIIEEKNVAKGIEFVYEVVFDKQPELRRQGYTHYYEDRNNNADPGYPTTGRYNYDKEIVRYTESITIEGNEVVQRYLKIHTDYYLNGQKTYADTETNWRIPEQLIKYSPPRQIGDKGREANAIDLGLSVKWASWNLGAKSEEDYGGYYAWGEVKEKDSYDWGNYQHCDGDSKSVHDIGNSICGSQYDAATVMWGNGWRLPSEQEIAELIRNCKKEMVSIKGVMGWRFTGSNGNSIFLPMAGEGKSQLSQEWGLSRYVGESLLYWSGNSIIQFPDSAQALARDDAFVPFGNYPAKCSGLSVRPVKK
jgi:tetratricopeptide (TPR) repeat protein